ncbi:MAG: SpoIIE family protein phosphatase [Bacteroidales bacterium]|nr:SpoIIE family protein phosphatase [Bacteroidales bacterium]
MKLKLFSLVALLCASLAAAAQEFSLAKFTNSSGLPQNYVYSVVQDLDGFVWIGMAEGLSKYDGVHFSNYSVRDSLADNYVSRMLLDTDGNLWLGHGNGRFSFYDGHNFHALPAVEEMSAPIKAMSLDDKGNIWAVEQNMGLVKITPDHKIVTYFDEEKFGSVVFSSVAAINSMSLLVGTDEGMMSVKVDIDGSLSNPHLIDGLDEAGVNCISRAKDGGYWIGMSDGSIFRYTLGSEVKKIERNTESCTTDGAATDYDIRALYEDAMGDLYVGTWGSGLKEWKYREATDDYVEALSLGADNGLGNDFVADIMGDREGILWFGTYGGGVVAWINNYFAEYGIANIGFVRNKITSAQVDGDRLWLGLNEGIISLDTQCSTNFEYFDTSSGLPAQTDVTAIVFDKNRKRQYVGTRGRGIYVRNDVDGRYRPVDVGASQQSLRIVNGMVNNDSTLFIATQGGLIVYSIVSGESKVYNTNNGLPHNNINFVFLDEDGQLWLGPKDSGIAMLVEDGAFDIHRLANVPVDVAGMTIDRIGRFWLATVNGGVLCPSNDSIVTITTVEGLEKNYCYGIAKDANEHIWVCHQPGLSCIDLSTGNIRTYGINQGMSYEFDGVAVSSDGDLWFPSSNGVVHYISAYDRRNSVPPIINLTNVVVDGKKKSTAKPISLPYPYDGNVAKLEFDFVGISMRDPANVSYEYWLQMGDEETERWMPLGHQSHKEFDFLPEGDYKLHIRAFNGEGITCEQPLVISIHIDKPFWKTIWFPFLALGALLWGFRLFSKWRERKLLRRQKELQDEVNRQTKEISDQKDEIERKNNDIMDSINYANLIQTSVLPSQDGLKDYPFQDSFILYLPRDVVSGDFYWFTRHENHVIICCGDCTGHGVHGAFLTMIGTTILNDAAHDPAMLTPCKLLDKLDKEIKATLNKNVTTEEKRDGMDCVIIDINLDTLEVVSAAARRPVNFIVKGNLETVKGTRRGIGEPRTANEFVETITQLHKGDYIYMCSDGFGDQMGGSPNDDDLIKFSTKRYNEMLMNLHELPMSEQKVEMDRILKEWCGHYERVDDVIVMGIKL